MCKRRLIQADLGPLNFRNGGRRHWTPTLCLPNLTTVVVFRFTTFSDVQSTSLQSRRARSVQAPCDGPVRQEGLPSVAATLSRSFGGEARQPSQPSRLPLATFRDTRCHLINGNATAGKCSSPSAVSYCCDLCMSANRCVGTAWRGKQKGKGRNALQGLDYICIHAIHVSWTHIPFHFAKLQFTVLLLLLLLQMSGL